MDKTTKNILIGVSVFVLALIVTLSSRTEASGGLVNASEFMEKYQSMPSAVLVDVRTPEEFAVSHIDGAVVIDFENPNFVTEVQKLDPSKTYFIYCRSGNRSGQATKIMRENGLKNVYDLRGGISANPQLLN